MGMRLARMVRAPEIWHGVELLDLDPNGHLGGPKECNGIAHLRVCEPMLFTIEVKGEQP